MKKFSRILNKYEVEDLRPIIKKSKYDSFGKTGELTIYFFGQSWISIPEKKGTLSTGIVYSYGNKRINNILATL